jgi:hypothetical protein
MEENAYQLSQHELEVHEVMKVHREEKVFPLIRLKRIYNF